jgi:ABC-type dipeptide/oligopeptide/nickel transport system permease subunit
MRTFFRSLFELIQKIASNRVALAGATIIALLAILALAAPLAQSGGLLRDPLAQFNNGLDADDMPLPPGGIFKLGTDNLGRDVLSRVMFGARVSLAVGLASMFTATLIGLTIGMIAGYFGNIIDQALMRLTEIMMAMPALLLGAAFAGFMDGRILHLHPSWIHSHALDFKLQQGVVSIFLLIGMLVWTGIVRLVRAEVIVIKERQYVQAARAFGASSPRIMLAHILPNILPTLLIVAAMSTASAILLEVSLSYLGIGAVQLPNPSWGLMIREGQPYFISSPHLVLVPGAAIVLTVLGFNLLGEGLRQVFDPLHRTRAI